MKNLHTNYCNSKQGYLPLFLSDCLDLLDPVLTFDRLMGGIDLNKYLTDIPEYTTGRFRYNPVNMLKTVLFGFMVWSKRKQVYLGMEEGYGEVPLQALRKNHCGDWWN